MVAECILVFGHDHHGICSILSARKLNRSVLLSLSRSCASVKGLCTGYPAPAPVFIWIQPSAWWQVYIKHNVCSLTHARIVGGRPSKFFKHVEVRMQERSLCWTMTSACGSLSGSVTWLSRTAMQLQAGISDMCGASHNHSMQQGMGDSLDERSHTGRIIYSGMIWTAYRRADSHLLGPFAL